MMQTHQNIQTRHTHFPNSGLTIGANKLPDRVNGISVMSRAESLQERRRFASEKPWYGEHYSLASAIAFGIGFMAISALTLEA